MKIYLPFTRLRSETFCSIPNPVLVPLVDRTYGYWNHFRERWMEEESFINVEQDVVVPSEVLESMITCKSSICFASYAYPDQPDRLERGTYLGCVKISAEFIQEHPTLFGGEPKDWHAPEAIIWNAIENKPPCYHDSVLHLHVDSRWPAQMINKYG